VPAAVVHSPALLDRLPADPGENELNTLVETLNRMLDQIEHLIDSIRNVSNAIAHDLRTPLAEPRSRLEEREVTRPYAEQTFAEIDGAIADVDRVTGIFNALLRLAELDTGVRRSSFIETDASKIATEAAEFYQPVAELKGVSLSLAAAGPMPLTKTGRSRSKHRAVPTERSRSPWPTTAPGSRATKSPRYWNASTVATQVAAHRVRASD
jgi:signal transduction histidine kinase